MAGVANSSETLWNKSFQRQLSRVRGAKYRDLFTALNYQSFQHSLTTLDKSYNDKRLNSCFHQLEPINFNAVEELLEKALAIKKRWGSPQSIPFEYAVHYEDLAYLRISQGKTIEACELIAKAVLLLEVDEAVHRDALTQFTFDWAVILLNSGEFEPALEKATAAHEMRKEIFGNTSAKTLHCLYWKANVLCHMERFDLAEDAFKEALKFAKDSDWSREAIARAEFRYSQVLRKKGQQDQAEVLEKTALASASDVLGENAMVPQDSQKRQELFDQMNSIYFGRSTGKLWVGELR